MAQSKIDANRKKTIIGVSKLDITKTINLKVNPATNAVIVEIA